MGFLKNRGRESEDCWFPLGGFGDSPQDTAETSEDSQGDGRRGFHGDSWRWWGDAVKLERLAQEMREQVVKGHQQTNRRT